jgi:hypothetical protein
METRPHKRRAEALLSSLPLAEPLITSHSQVNIPGAENAKDLHKVFSGGKHNFHLKFAADVNALVKQFVFR